jgi:pantetheine-phosphate adenylyltransferase
MKSAIYPGSFDPVTLGHLDVIERSSKVVDHLIVGVLNNNVKNPLFSVEERVEMLESVTSHLPNVEIQSFSGLLIDFARKTDSYIIIRGLRAITDFEYELQMAQTNQKIAPNIETMFLTTNLEYSYLSSSTVKEVAWFGGDISQFVPPLVVERVRRKYEEEMEKE